VDLRLGVELKEVIGTERATGVLTSDGEEIDCGFVGLTVGVGSNVAFLKESAIETNRGVLINEYFETQTPNVYAIGDCAEFRTVLPNRKPIEQVWYTGRIHGEVVAQTICGNRTAYQPGHWFNSAKFFDIEYQTYGVVAPTLLDGQATYYWEHTNGKISFRIVYNKIDGKMIGVNAFGIRLRHACFDKWLKENRGAKYVMAHLEEAFFDPEFFKSYYREICAKWII
jgi:NAD(P)H-nitrite reductase large subunit